MVSPNLNEYLPDNVSPPGDTLLEILEERGMTQADLAERTGRPRKTINEIIKGKAAITADTALQFERVLGVPAKFWHNREQQYRDSIARQAERESLKGMANWVKQFPIRKMVEYGWVTTQDDPVDMLREILNFFGIASPMQWQNVWESKVAFRKSTTFESDPFAVSAWLRKGELEAQEINCEPYDSQTFLEILRVVRSLTTAPPKVFQTESVHLCAQAGVALAYVPELPNARISGATSWLTPQKALIQVSLRYKWADQLWFSFFHEAGHILKHGKRDLFIEDGGERDEKEEEADRFAADFLIPPRQYWEFTDKTGCYSKEEIREFAEHIGIDAGIVVGRLQHDSHLEYKNCNDLRQRLRWVLQEYQG